MALTGTRRILVVTPSPPAPGRSGFDARVYHLVRRLATRHSVTVACYRGQNDKVADEVADAIAALRGVVEAVHAVPLPPPAGGSRRVAQLASMGSRQSFEWRRLWSKPMQGLLDELLRRPGIDVVQLESSRLGAFKLPAGPRVILDEHNIEYELAERMAIAERTPLRRAYNRQEASKLRRLERGLWTAVDGCAVSSERERVQVLSLAPALQTAVVPNGVDLDYFRPGDGARRDPLGIVLTGTFNYRPNVDAAVHLVTDILPLVQVRFPEASVTICGQHPPREVTRLESARVHVTGRVEDVRPYIDGAAVVAVPLRIGGGTRLKVLEALAMARPLVSTSLGCEGLGITHGAEACIAHDAPGFADQVCHLLGEPLLAAELGRRGRALVESAYGWDLAAERLEELHDRVATGPRAGDSGSRRPRRW